jgi:hypothetical protein
MKRNCIKWLVLAGLAGCATTIMAQTNTFPTGIGSNISPSTLQDLIKLLQDLGISISNSNILKDAGYVILVARLIRKYAPDSINNGRIGKLISHAALELSQQALPSTPSVSPK